MNTELANYGNDIILNIYISLISLPAQHTCKFLIINS